MKKTIVLVLIFLILFTSYSSRVEAGLKIWPGKLTVEMNKWLDEEKEIKHPIQIINPYSHGVNVSSKIENPTTKLISEKFSPLPDTSWILTNPDILYIPPKSEGYIEVIFNIPEDQQDMYYNEKWQTGVVISSDIPIGPIGGSMNFELEIAIKLYIITPKSELEEFQYYYIILLIFLIIILLIVASFVKKKKKNLRLMYYFRKKK
ncbi:MAG: hypothetical protein JSU91_05310 [Thermoplasmatales archaeon]|nr:MAG: hypothetical protein JSU91_05310 [Thermoplasmatales archaeon]